MNSPPRLENLQCRQPRLKWGKKRNLQSLVIKLARSSYVQLHPLPPENGNQYFVADDSNQKNGCQGCRIILECE